VRKSKKKALSCSDEKIRRGRRKPGQYREAGCGTEGNPYGRQKKKRKGKLLRKDSAKRGTICRWKKKPFNGKRQEEI